MSRVTEPTLSNAPAWIADTAGATPPLATRTSRGGRIIRGAIVALLLSLGLGAVAEALRIRFVNPSFFTGYLLIGVVLFLAAFNLRKRFAALPLFRSAAWLRLHLDAGFLAIGVYVVHTQGRWPNGILETIVAALFVGTAASGLYGLFATLTIPRQLTALRTEVIFEHIPRLRRQIAAEAERLALAGAHETTVLARAYETNVAPFLQSPRSVTYFLFPTGTRRRQLVALLRDLNRYLSNERRQECQRLELLVCQKDDLDYHAALQGRLKLWLFVHIGLTYSLIAAAVWHGVLAHAFHGGPR